MITTRAWEGGPKDQKITGPCKNGRLKLVQIHIYQGSPCFPIFRTLSRSLHRHSSVAQGHQFTPSIQPNLSLLLNRPHWLRPSTPFWPYSNHPFFPHTQTISILSDLPYSLTPFLFQLSYAHLLIPNSIHSRHSNNNNNNNNCCRIIIKVFINKLGIQTYATVPTCDCPNMHATVPTCTCDCPYMHATVHIHATVHTCDCIPTCDCPYKRLSPQATIPTGGCRPKRLSPQATVPTRDCPYTRRSPQLMETFPLRHFKWYIIPLASSRCNKSTATPGITSPPDHALHYTLPLVTTHITTRPYPALYITASDHSLH